MQDRPRDRDPLTLAARQRVSPLADHGVVPVRQLADEVVRVRRLRRRDHLLQRRLRQAVADVVQHRAVEQVRILEHHADLPAVVPGVELAHVHAVDPDRAARHVVETRDQVHDRRLAAARRPDEADQLTRLHVEAHAAQHLPHAVVGERHVLERHPALHRLEPHRLRRVPHLRLGVQHLEHPMRRRRRPVHRARHLADHLDRRHEHRRVEQERHERPRSRAAAPMPSSRGTANTHTSTVVACTAEHQQRPERRSTSGGCG